MVKMTLNDLNTELTEDELRELDAAEKKNLYLMTTVHL